MWGWLTSIVKADPIAWRSRRGSNFDSKALWPQGMNSRSENMFLTWETDAQDVTRGRAASSPSYPGRRVRGFLRDRGPWGAIAMRGANETRMGPRVPEKPPFSWLFRVNGAFLVEWPKKPRAQAKNGHLGKKPQLHTRKRPIGAFSAVFTTGRPFSCFFWETMALFVDLGNPGSIFGTLGAFGGF